MPTFSAPDGTRLAYRTIGDGDPLLCLPGGPMQDAAYLGDLGGLARHRRLLLLDPRGTGDSAVPGDGESYRCDRQVDDVEALRQHLGLGRIDLLGHSASVNLVVQYATRHPEAVRRLVLITPSLIGVGIPVPGEMRRETAQLRKNEPWFPAAVAALAAIGAGKATEADWAAITPLRYGRWDEAAQRHHAESTGRINLAAAEVFGSAGAFTPDATRAALATFPAPVLLLAGEFDLNSPPPAVAEYAALFPDATLVVQPEAGHQPWLDDPDRFVATVATFLE
ncbi:alpha/beta hydrolase [Actinoplanes sp. ATCC 53533]|uniref:alpha/beta fold hydrolase n=1 Tax=Actinoplanes sp. ATCC 53533 TaxID=1288362 RepID=UPI000F7B6AC0|nr:alpha/beta hydrolase [Actinoplanes sp. ATCC 53533]RSM51283.1 alpha/beta hydrolase [Actinoplanes sp. ATCC 53533]